jgi:hypothetical protein
MDEKITIIEGPPPTFEVVKEGWVSGLSDSISMSNIVLTRLRTFNGPSLVERCHRAWSNQHTIYLEYRAIDGLEQRAPIVAARTLEVEDGQLLLLWVRLEDEETPLELGLDDDLDDDADDDFGLPK